MRNAQARASAVNDVTCCDPINCDDTQFMFKLRILAIITLYLDVLLTQTTLVAAPTPDSGYFPPVKPDLQACNVCHNIND